MQDLRWHSVLSVQKQAEDVRRSLEHHSLVETLERKIRKKRRQRRGLVETEGDFPRHFFLAHSRQILHLLLDLLVKG